ncbi:mitochondrial phosphate carrier protein [Pseudohyphozyma bogoriensis]|nr:mitochondrial phosphate carrier protein [Pseudohyphozyma bogoriensis]
MLSGSFLSGLTGTPSFAPAFQLGGVAASVVDDAKAKAKELESKASSELDSLKSAASKELNKTEKAVKSAAAPGIPLYTPKFYAACTLGGILACGTTHALVTPLDLVKCRKQVNKDLYKGNVDGWTKIIKNEGGFKALYTGVGPTLLGYSMQGAAKYGLYEYFKHTYAEMAGPEAAAKYKDAIFLAGSASAEFFADMALVPMETVKVRMQTTMPPFATGIVDGYSKIVAKEGTGALFASITSLWGRQIPYTMMKFWSFEATVAAIYKQLGKPKESYNKLEQLGVTTVSGYIAGVFCAVVSHPADTMVSKLNAPLKEGQAKPTVGSIYKDIGFGGLWGGLATRIVMIGTLTALQWLIYDSFKVQVGLPTSGDIGRPTIMPNEDVDDHQHLFKVYDLPAPTAISGRTLVQPVRRNPGGAIVLKDIANASNYVAQIEHEIQARVNLNSLVNELPLLVDLGHAKAYEFSLLTNFNSGDAAPVWMQPVLDDIKTIKTDIQTIKSTLSKQAATQARFQNKVLASGTVAAERVPFIDGTMPEDDLPALRYKADVMGLDIEQAERYCKGYGIKWHANTSVFSASKRILNHIGIEDT